MVEILIIGQAPISITELVIMRKEMNYLIWTAMKQDIENHIEGLSRKWWHRSHIQVLGWQPSKRGNPPSTTWSLGILTEHAAACGMSGLVVVAMVTMIPACQRRAAASRTPPPAHKTKFQNCCAVTPAPAQHWSQSRMRRSAVNDPSVSQSVFTITEGTGGYKTLC